MANELFETNSNPSSSSSTSTSLEDRSSFSLEPSAPSSSSTSTSIPEETLASDDTGFMVSQAAETIMGFPEFEHISSEDAFELLTEDLTEEELEDEDVQRELADQSFKIRRAKGETLTEEDISEVADSLGIEFAELDLNTATTDEVVLAIEEFGDKLEAGVKLTLGEDAVKAKREVAIVIDDMKKAYRRELLPRVGGEDTDGIVGETMERLGRGFTSGFAAMFRSEDLATVSEGLGDPTKDDRFSSHVSEGVGQFGADLGVVGVFAGGGALLGPGGAAAGALLGTGVILTDKTTRAIGDAYDSVLKETGDESKAIQGAIIAVPFAVGESILDAFVLRGATRPLLGIGRKLSVL